MRELGLEAEQNQTECNELIISHENLCLCWLYLMQYIYTPCKFVFGLGVMHATERCRTSIV